jgi:hypothetical protein
MAARTLPTQSEHDAAVLAAGAIYAERGKLAWTNPNGQKNKSWCELYIDVIVAADPSGDRAWVTEVETADSVSETEASAQWEDYARAYATHWYLAAPVGSDQEAGRLLRAHGITNCTVITSQRNPNGSHSFWGLPGLA